jgi:choline dehydrogenase-like flavoprotein
MFQDARTLPDGTLLETDLCIVGAGLAGITLAREFAGAPFRVCLLESGGILPDKATQSLYWGENVGQPYYPLDTSRTRFFGGTSHCWHIGLGGNRQGVRLREMDPIDFQVRDWVPDSGWPFGKAHLDPYYERARAICGIGPYTSDPRDWEDEQVTPRLPFLNGEVKTTIFRFADRELVFKTYRQEIENAGNISTYLHGNAVEIETDETAGQVSAVRCRTLDGGEFRIRASRFVLALGGIETPRLLLLSTGVQKQGLGNGRDLVGRYFMEHPHLWSGVLKPANLSLLARAGLYAVHTRNGVPIMGKLALSEDVQRRERLRNWCVSLHPTVCPGYLRYPLSPSKGVDSLKAIIGALGRGELPERFGDRLGTVLTDVGGLSKAMLRKTQQRMEKEGRRRRMDIFRLNHMAEQEPNPESRVRLGEERDMLGQRRIELDWRLTPEDMRSMRRSQEILDRELRSAGLGGLVIEMEGDGPPPGLHGGWHHMGTTRMHADPRKGVVDPDCQVHGVANLYIGGASVFPTGGCANPVLTTVALVARLADHLKGLFRDHQSVEA